MTGSTSSLPSWVNTINDVTIRNDISAALSAGSVTFASMQQLFQDVASEVSVSGALTAAQFQDLNTVVNNLASTGASSYVQFISAALVQGNGENDNYTGGEATATALGNLAAGSGYTQLDELIGTWLLGNNDPSTQVASYASDVGNISYVTTTLPLYSAGGPSINDINQGDLGDCYLVCGLAEVALQDPNAIQQMIRDNGNGTYGVRFFFGGQVVWVTVDSSLASSNGAQPFNDAYVLAQNMWVDLIEKAYAELSIAGAANWNGAGWAGNSFSSVGNGGWPDITIAQVTGATQLNYLDAGTSDNRWATETASAASPQTFVQGPTLDADSLAFNALVSAFNAHDDVVLSSYTDTKDSSGNDELMSSHSFSVIGYNLANQTIELRNPWGTKTGQNWDTTFYVSLSTFVGTGDYFAYDNNGSPNAAPTVQANSITLTANSTAFATAAGISATDYNGISLASIIYTISYTGTGGTLYLSGVAEHTGSSFTVTGANLPNLRYVIAAGGGVDTVTISAKDTKATSTSVVFTVTTDNLRLAPSITVTSTTLSGSSAFLYLASLFSVVDHNGVAFDNLTFTVTDEGTAGTLEYDGRAVAANQSVSMLGSQLQFLSYVGGGNGGSDGIALTVSDGLSSATASLTITLPSLHVTPDNLTVTSVAQSFAASTLFSATDPTGTITSYTIQAPNTSVAAGYFELNGQAVTLDGDYSFTITAAQLSSLTYVSPIVGNDVIWITANDGTYSSNVAKIQVTGPAPVAPTVSVQPGTIETEDGTILSPLSLASLVTVVDKNEEPSSDWTYTFTNQGGGGYFVLNGGAYYNQITVKCSQINDLSFMLDNGITAQTLSLQVSDVFSRSAAVSFTVTTTPAPLPVVTGYNITTSLPSQTYAASALFSATGTITSYTISDEASGSDGGGYFMLNGAPITDVYTLGNEITFSIQASQLSDLTYVSPIVGNDYISITAYDGIFYSLPYASIKVTGPAIVPPTLTVQSDILAYGGARSVALSSLISASDNNGLPNSDFIYTVYIYDNGTNGGHSPDWGYFEVNGVNEGQTIYVTQAQLAETTYVSTAPFGIDYISVNLSDGEPSEAYGHFTITSQGPSVPEIITQAPSTLVAHQTVAISPLVFVWDPDNTSAADQIYTISYSGSAGQLELQGVAEATDSAFTVSGTDLSNLTYVAGHNGGTDIISISYSNGTQTSATATLSLTSAAEDGPFINWEINSLTPVKDGETFTPGGFFDVSEDAYYFYPLTQYEFEVNSPAGALGYISIGGVIQANNAPFTIDASSLAGFVYTVLSGTQTITARVNDGTAADPHWGPWATIAIVAPPVSLTKPSVTAKSVTLSDFTNNLVAAASIVTTDMNGVDPSSLTYTIGYSTPTGETQGGTIYVNGTALWTGITTTLTAAQWAELSYSPSVSGGTVVVQVTVADVYATSGYFGFIITSPDTSGPVIKAVPALARLTTPVGGGTFGLSSLFTYNDATPNTTIFSFDFEDVAGAGSTGNFLFGTTAEVNGTAFVLTPAQLSQLTYTITSGTQTLFMRGNDGTDNASNAHWGAWTKVTVASAAPKPPVVAVHSATLNNAAPFANFSSLISVADANGVSTGQITYTIGYTGTGGVLSYNGTTEATGTNFTVNAALLSQLSYAPGLYGGTVNITLTANDTFATSAAATFTITSPNTPGPVFTPTSTPDSVSRDQVISNLIPQLWTETDADPNATISQYEFYDSDTSGGLGSFLEGSVVKTVDPNDKIIPVSAADLSTIVYEGIAGSQILYVRANDGTLYNPHWGAWASVTVKAPPATIGPIVTPDSTTIAAARAENFSTPEGDLTSPLSLFTETDPTGGTIEQYDFFVSDSGGGLGNLIVNGKAQANDKSLIIDASVISDVLSYQVVAGTETLWVRASDGTDAHPIWGAWASVVVTAPTAAGPQVVVPETSMALTRGQTYQLDAWFSVSDPTTTGVYSQVEFYVGDRTGAGGAIGGTGGLSIGGAVWANDSGLIVAYGALDSVDYTAASGTEIIYIRANDGTSAVPHWGAWTAITTTAPAATLGAVFTPLQTTISATRDKQFTLPNALFSQSETAGLSIYQYEFFVSDKAGGVGDMLLDGNPVANDTPLYLTATELSSYPDGLTYQSVAGVEIVYVRANTGSANFPVWGAWAAVTVVNKTPITETAICTPVNAALTATQDYVYSNLIPNLWTSRDTTRGATISQYQFFDGDALGGKGSFLLNGSVTTNDTTLTIGASGLSDITYTIHSGKQIIYVRANDGTPGAPIWSAWSAITVTSSATTAAVAASPVTQIPSLSAGALVSTLPSAAQSVISPATLLSAAGQQSSPLFAVTHH